jgi:hypothetical protein
MAYGMQKLGGGRRGVIVSAAQYGGVTWLVEALWRMASKAKIMSRKYLCRHSGVNM